MKRVEENYKALLRQAPQVIVRHSGLLMLGALKWEEILREL